MDNSYAQLPKTVLVGLPEASVRESVHRIERATCNLGYQLPDGRTVINLAPARCSRLKDAAVRRTSPGFLAPE
ncbi:MAG TPA: magnesium chelatase domain-containing protein [Gemmataceae bacterium]|nr:magnesium chelatase domain-containing protein [Gemmataceae bacterium]